MHQFNWPERPRLHLHVQCRSSTIDPLPGSKVEYSDCLQPLDSTDHRRWNALLGRHSDDSRHVELDAARFDPMYLGRQLNRVPCWPCRRLTKWSRSDRRRTKQLVTLAAMHKGRLMWYRGRIQLRVNSKQCAYGPSWWTLSFFVPIRLTAVGWRFAGDLRMMNYQEIQQPLLSRMAAHSAQN